MTHHRTSLPPAIAVIPNSGCGATAIYVARIPRPLALIFLDKINQDALPCSEQSSTYFVTTRKYHPPSLGVPIYIFRSMTIKDEIILLDFLFSVHFRYQWFQHSEIMSEGS